MDPGAMLGGRTRETDIRRDALGRWWKGDVPITHPLLVSAFDSWIDRAEDGRLCLRNDINWAYVTIEGAPIFVRAVELDGGRAILRLSDGRTEELDPTSLRESEDGALHCSVRGGSLAARFDNAASMQLAPVLAEDERGPFLALGSTQVRPPVVADPLAWP